MVGAPHPVPFDGPGRAEGISGGGAFMSAHGTCWVPGIGAKAGLYADGVRSFVVENPPQTTRILEVPEIGAGNPVTTRPIFQPTAEVAGPGLWAAQDLCPDDDPDCPLQTCLVRVD
jgi:hypothetical protein